MLNLKKALAEDIIAGLKAAGIEMPVDMKRALVERAQKEGVGDYASPIALALAKKTGKKPMELVEAIAAHMPKKEYIGKLEAAPPGFLNITISNDWLVSRLDDIVEEDMRAAMNIGEGKHVNLEFISANPTGPLTLGNARTAFSADTLGNILDFAGFNVTREYYINDAGEQVRRLGESVLRRALQAKGEQVEFAEDLYQGDYVKDIASTIAEQWRENEGKEFTKADLENTEILEKISWEAMEICLAAIKKTIHDDLKIHFDIWTSERALRKSGVLEKVLATFKKKQGLVYEQDGALWLKTTDFGEEKDKVLVKSTGQYAYIFPDIAYHQDKFDRKFDLIFTFLGADHIGQVSKLRAALEVLGNDISKLRFVIAQWLSIVRDGQEVKLSKRAGHVFGPSELIAEIGYDAARFFLVQHALSTHMTLDLSLAKERSERNPVYYVQYAYVRLQSILRKAKEQGYMADIGHKVPQPDHMMLTEAAEINLIRAMYRLPEVIFDITHSFDAHDLAYFAQEFAKKIHSFYRDVPVLASQDKDLVLSRLQLVSAAHKTLSQTLDLLGIGKPNIM